MHTHPQLPTACDSSEVGLLNEDPMLEAAPVVYGRLSCPSMAGFWLPGWPLLNPGLGRNVCGQEQRPENAFLYIAGPGETSTCFWVTWFYEGGRPQAHRN